MKEKIKTLKLWIEKADQDLGTAELTYHHIPDYREIIAFHCQQAVEKYLRAVLIFMDVSPPRTHDLVMLLGLISNTEKIADELFDKAAELQDYAVEARYPDTLINLSDDDLLQALEIARTFREFALSKTNPSS